MRLEVLQKIFDTQSNLTELYDEPSYDDFKETLSNYLNPSEEDDTTT